MKLHIWAHRRKERKLNFFLQLCPNVALFLLYILLLIFIMRFGSIWGTSVHFSTQKYIDNHNEHLWRGHWKETSREWDNSGGGLVIVFQQEIANLGEHDNRAKHVQNHRQLRKLILGEGVKRYKIWELFTILINVSEKQNGKVDDYTAIIDWVYTIIASGDLGTSYLITRFFLICRYYH